MPTAPRPMDVILKQRLLLKGDRPWALPVIRAFMGAMDAVNRAFFGSPFFALRESEEMLDRLSDQQGFDAVRTVLAERGGTRIAALGLEHVPETGGVIIASLHPTGLFDFVAHAGALIRQRPDLKVVANRDTEIFLGPELMIPVAFSLGSQVTSGRETQDRINAHLSVGGAVLIFGSGHVADRKNGMLYEPAWRGGATRCSRDTGVPVIPAAVRARNSNAYYRTRTIAKCLTRSDPISERSGTLRYFSELLHKLGGEYETVYGPQLPPRHAIRRSKTGRY